MENNRSAKTVLETSLPFERRILDLERQMAKATSEDERGRLRRELAREQETVYSNLSAWQRVQLARHALRPRMMDYVNRIFEDFIELHGDRALGDDPAMVTGLARYKGRTVAIAGQQKGVTTEEKVRRNFGMAHPEGYRKALRIFRLAERLKLPVITFVDTPAAHPGIEAEQHGQGPAIALNLLESSRINTPIMVSVLGEGGSGGALAVAVGDWVAMFEYAIYVICPPERCAEILWRDVDKKELAAEAMKVTALDLFKLGAIDSILEEPNGGAHRDPDAAARVLAKEIDTFLAACDEGKWSVEKRQEKFRKMGVWEEALASKA